MADQDSNADPAGSRQSASRLAQDLRAIREQRNVSLDDVQRDTRMPADILGRFEAGDLIGDQHYNEVYLRNLLKSYAQALGISPQEVTNAYDQVKSGSYDGGLRRRYLDGGATPKTDAPPPSVDAAEEAAPVATHDETPKKRKPPVSTDGNAPAVAALSGPRQEKDESKAKAKEEASLGAVTKPKRRVAEHRSGAQPIDKSWGLIIGGIIAALVVIALVLWFLFRDPGPEPELAAVPTPTDTTEVTPEPDSVSTPEPVQTTSAPSFQTPIQLTIVANEEPLEEFRVRVDDDVRTPYWLNPETQESFTAQQEVVVWGELSVGESGGGEYDGATLRLQGLEWTPSSGSVVRINQQTGQALLDSLARASNPASSR